MLSVWQRNLVDRFGNVVPNASVEVRDTVTGELSEIYSDSEGNTPLDNPFTSDASGFAKFYARGGLYNITVHAEGAPFTWEEVSLGALSHKDEITADVITDDADELAAIRSKLDVAAAEDVLSKDNNLSDLSSALLARQNLGLGTAAIYDASDFDEAGSAALVADSLEALEGSLGELAVKDTVSEAIGDADAGNVNARLGVFQTVADVEGRNIPPVLDSIRTNGYYDPGDGGGALYKRVASEPSHAGKIQSADGAWWEIGKQPSYNAAQFGFRVTNSAADNQAALNAMLDVAQGNPCYVDAESDFDCNRVDRHGEDVDLTFRGSGRWLRTTTFGALRLTSDYDQVQPASLTKQSTTINGSPDTLVRISVADASAYSRGDVIRIVSDDIDPDAATSGSRRRGEFAEVVKVDASSGYVWVPDAVEDFDHYQTNVRIGRLIKRQVNVRGLRILSSEDISTGHVVSLRSLYRPYIEVEIEHAGWICVHLAGCYGAEVHFRGSGKGDASGSLGYGINDSNGKDNVIYCRGRNFRHLTTTNFATSSPNDPRLDFYGATRGHTVIDGFAEAAQGAPFDDHPGARGTRWINCKAVNSVHTSSSAPCAFQARGRDAEVVNPWVDASYDAVLRVSGLTAGVTYIRGGRAYCNPLDAFSTVARKAPVVIEGLVSDVNSGSIIRFDNMSVTLRGGIYRDRTSSDFRQTVYLEEGAVLHLDGPEFVYAGAGDSYRFIRLAHETAQALGSFRARSDGTATPFLFATTGMGSDAMVRLSILWTGGDHYQISGTLNDAIYTGFRTTTDTIFGNSVTDTDALRKILAAMA